MMVDPGTLTLNSSPPLMLLLLVTREYFPLPPPIVYIHAINAALLNQPTDDSKCSICNW